MCRRESYWNQKFKNDLNSIDKNGIIRDNTVLSEITYSITCDKSRKKRWKFHKTVKVIYYANLSLFIPIQII